MIDAERKRVAPFLVLARNNVMGKESAENIELMCRIHFDTVRRNVCGEVGRNFLAFNILTAALIAKEMKSKPLEALAIAAYNSVYNANARNPALLQLTTTEYMQVRMLMNKYFEILPAMQVGTVSDCSRNAHLIYEGEKVRIAA